MNKTPYNMYNVTKTKFDFEFDLSTSLKVRSNGAVKTPLF